MASEEPLENVEEPLFDPSLKKKKKKKTVAFNEDPLAGEDGTEEATAPSAIPPAPGPSILKPTTPDGAGAGDGEEKKDDDFAAMFGDVKKKKKKKEIPLDLESEVTAPSGTGEGGGDDLGFGDLKKKGRKSSKKAAFDLDAFEKELGEADFTPADDGLDDAIEEDLGEDVFAAPSAPIDVGDEQETWHGTDRDYEYVELLRRIAKTLRAQNPDLSASGRKRYTIVPPSVHREGNKKTIFANIAEICKRMHRQPEHVIQFLFAELGTSGSVDGSQRLVIKGRFQQKQLENVLRRYIVEYVTCKTCKSPDTLLTKENRIYFMSCESCGSRRSVSAIKTGFQAQVGKRKLQKTT